MPTSSHLWGCWACLAHVARGLHVVVEPAASGAAEEEPRQLSIPAMSFFHVPKTGSGFINSLLTIGCPQIGEEEHRGLKVTGPNLIRDWMKNSSHKCAAGFDFCHGAFADHMPITDHPGGCYSWGERKGQFMGMFRVPEQRLVSAFHNGRHSYYGRNFKTITVEEYARGSLGCAVKMLAGEETSSSLHLPHPCAWNDETNYVPTPVMLQTAVRRLEEGFIFVGLTEEWALSVCLFHAMFGGQCHESEFSNDREFKTKRSADLQGLDQRWDTSPLHGVVDPYDGKLYQVASSIFWNNIKKYNVDAPFCRMICQSYPDTVYDDCDQDPQPKGC